MAKFFDNLDTDEGTVWILTKTRWAMLFPMPHTSVMPHRPAELKKLGTLIKWDTNEPALLRGLHERVVGLVKDFGLSGIREIAESARMTQHLAKITNDDWHSIVNIAAREGVDFPLPDDILKHVKGFV